MVIIRTYSPYVVRVVSHVYLVVLGELFRSHGIWRHFHKEKWKHNNNYNDDTNNVGSDISSSVYNDDDDNNDDDDSDDDNDYDNDNDDIRVEEDVEINYFNWYISIPHTK